MNPEQVQEYVEILRASKTAADTESAEKRVAAIWFVMDGPTQTAALVAACRENLLEPRVTKSGSTLYPVVHHDKVIWVTIPDRD